MAMEKESFQLCEPYPELKKYFNLPQPEDEILAEYIWIDITRSCIRSITRVLDFIPEDPSYLSVISIFEDRDQINVTLNPIAIYSDPFRPGKNKLILCDTYNKYSILNMSRYKCNRVIKAARYSEPWFGIEQEYSFINTWNNRNKSLKVDYYSCATNSNGKSYYRAASPIILGRQISEAHLRACQYAGVKIAGSNSTNSTLTWMYQIGPCEGISAADDLWMSRYILQRIVEDANMQVTLQQDNISTKFSTKRMRRSNNKGTVEIEKAINKLIKESIKKDSACNSMEHLPGKNVLHFSPGVGVSVPLSDDDADNKYWDPYTVCSALVEFFDK